jgi:hypothetical protein
MILNTRAREQVRTAADRLQSSFVWRDTPEGHDYWEKIVERLKEMGRELPPSPYTENLTVVTESGNLWSRIYHQGMEVGTIWNVLAKTGTLARFNALPAGYAYKPVTVSGTLEIAIVRTD